MTDGSSLAVSGLPIPQPDLILRGHMVGFSSAVMRNEEYSLRKASESARIKRDFSKRFSPEQNRISKRLEVVHKEIAKIEDKIYKTKDPGKRKVLAEERKPLIEESTRLRERQREIADSIKVFEGTNPRLRRLKAEASDINLQNHAVLASISRQDPEAAGYLRSYVAENDKAAEDAIAASSFIGVSYGSGAFGLPETLPR